MLNKIVSICVTKIHTDKKFTLINLATYHSIIFTCYGYLKLINIKDMLDYLVNY